jgi:hypothetical protein
MASRARGPDERDQLGAELGAKSRLGIYSIEDRDS